MKNKRIALIPATIDDYKLLYDWVNDKEVRKNAFNSNQILLDDHIEWLKSKLKMNNDYIYILYNNNQPIGQIRLESKDDSTLISYSVDIKYRGQGYGLILLKETIQKIKINKLPIKNLIAKVKKNNIASRKIFNKLDFVEIEKEHYYEYTFTIDKI